MQDAQILELYMARDEKAIAETDRKYGSYCHSVANGILENWADAEEAVNDTWVRAWDTIPPQHPQNFKMYLAKITRNLALSINRTKHAVKRGGGVVDLALEELDHCIPARDSVEVRFEGKELGEVIRRFLDTLPWREQNLFIRRYFFLESIETIARRFDLKESNVSKILSRTRAKLHQFLKKEGYCV